MKIDLHLHSKHSKRPSQWVLQKIGCPESFTDPPALYRITKKKGMSGMTLTDHNTINGCLEIAHLPETFISEEVTTYFPEDRCKVHLLVFGVNEAIHEDIQKIRENIFDLVGYLNERKTAHALAIARILHLPISGTYHTAIPQYAAKLTGDEAVEQLVWRYTLWYYDQMEFIYVPSGDIGDELAAKGLNPAKIRLYPRGVDIEAFHPANRNGFFDRRYNLGRKIKLLYVSRVSKEKNLPLLVEAFRELNRIVPEAHLIVVGDGPYLKTMKDKSAGWPVTFTGYLQGRDLSEAYASADLFVFPSTTDTFGNVVLEAQASGLPVIVTDSGGPRENILPGRTGIVVPANDPEKLFQAMRDLTLDPLRREQMSRAARKFMESRSFEQAFLQHWQLYTQGLEDDCPESMAQAV